MALQDILDKIGGQQGQQGGLAAIQNLFGNTNMQGMLSQLSDNGLGQQVQSWVGTGDNQPISSTDVRRAVDPATLDQMARQNGMSTDEFSGHIAQALPDMVDQATPDGRLPSQDPFAQNMSGMRGILNI